MQTKGLAVSLALGVFLLGAFAQAKAPVAADMDAAAVSFTQRHCQPDAITLKAAPNWPHTTAGFAAYGTVAVKNLEGAAKKVAQTEPNTRYRWADNGRDSFYFVVLNAKTKMFTWLTLRDRQSYVGVCNLR